MKKAEAFAGLCYDETASEYNSVSTARASYHGWFLPG